MVNILRSQPCLALAVLFSGLSTFAQPASDSSLDQVARTQAIEAIAERLTGGYISSEVAAKCAARLRDQLQRGAYDGLDSPRAFARALTEDLRSVADDRHMEVIVQPPAPTTTAPAASPDAWVDDLRRRNFDFYKVQRLSGNVGYLDLRSFPPTSLAKDAAVSSLGFLSNSDAVIIDLRRNSGGDGSLVQFLSSYFFDKPVHLSTAYKRRTNETREDWTLAEVPGKRMTDVELFVLTSSATFSAAEAFAYQLQAHRRATTVGAQTRGGANPGGYEPATPRFSVFVPDVLITSPVTGKNWEGVGVTPDIAADADDALTVAHGEALKRLVANATEPARKQELRWAAEKLAAIVKSPDLPPDALQSIAGSYGPRTISYVNGRLSYRRDQGPASKLIPLGNDAFALDEVDGVKLRIERDASRRAVRLVIMYADGSVQSSDRSP